MMGKKVMSYLDQPVYKHPLPPQKKKSGTGRGGKGAAAMPERNAQDTRANLMSRTPSVAMI